LISTANIARLLAFACPAAARRTSKAQNTLSVAMHGCPRRQQQHENRHTEIGQPCCLTAFLKNSFVPRRIALLTVCQRKDTLPASYKLYVA